MVSGGVVAAYLLQQNQHDPITPGDGALVGLMAGADRRVRLSGPVRFRSTLLLAPMERAMIERIHRQRHAAARGARVIDGTPGAARAGRRLLHRRCIVGLMSALGVVFSTLGGILGAVIFRKKPTPPAVIDIPPSQM